ncbi:MAG: hypothetical protein GX275_02895 [Clostridiales bacterium]|nr:hypothetical protein [Clostridiales bacterium]
MTNKYNDDDYCDIYENKICDNCGKCLEEQGIDIKAIKIEDIAKDVEENKVLEEEYKRELAEIKLSMSKKEEEELKIAYEKFQHEHADVFDEEYEDAFDHIEYLEDEDFFEEGNLEEMTEEIFPGLRKIKKKKSE